MLQACHHKTLEKLKLQTSSPIVLIKVSTIVLKEGRSERGYSTRTRLVTSASAHGKVQGEGLC